jgi:hypothetical protein
VARDAFNGITLWKKPIPDWGPNLRDFRSGPAEIGRRMVAVGDEVFVTLGFEAPVAVLDAATGGEKAILPETAGAEEILVAEGVMLAVTGSPRAELRDWSSPKRDFTTGEEHKRSLVAVDAATRKLLWKRQDPETATVLPMTLTAGRGRMFFINDQGVTAVDVKTGEHLFATELLPEQEKLEPGPLKPRAQANFTRVMRQYAPAGIALQWSTNPGVLVKGMTVAGPRLVVAGPPFELHPSSFLVDPATDRIRIDSAPDLPEPGEAAIARAHEGLTGDEPPRLLVLEKATGKEVAGVSLSASPVFDGLIAAGGRLYVCLEDGVVTCLGAR